MIIFTLHKPIALGMLVFLALIITGGLSSIEKVMPAFILKIHQIMPYLTVISVGMILYLLLLWGSRVTSAAR